MSKADSMDISCQFHVSLGASPKRKTTGMHGSKDTLNTCGERKFLLLLATELLSLSPHHVNYRQRYSLQSKHKLLHAPDTQILDYWVVFSFGYILLTSYLIYKLSKASQACNLGATHHCLTIYLFSSNQPLTVHIFICPPLQFWILQKYVIGTLFTSQETSSSYTSLFTP